MSARRPPVAPRRPRWPWVVAGAVALALAATGVTVAAVVRSHDRARPAAAVPAGSSESPAAGRTIVAPGTRSGTVRSGGVVVVGADYDLGRVPLMVTVVPTWQLRNATDHVVTLGEAKVETACCPGTLTVVSHTLAPATSTTVQLALRMQPGAEGRHRFVVVVPVVGASRPLRFEVEGDFGV
jgi:hypothetical protein